MRIARSSRSTRLSAILVSSILLVLSLPTRAGNCGWSRVDHRVSYDASGAWNPSVYRDIVSALTIAQIGGRRLLLIGGTASITGEDSRHVGKVDAQLLMAVTELSSSISFRATASAQVLALEPTSES